MRSVLPIMILLAIFSVLRTATADGADWLTLPSDYTHDPATGLRVTQYVATPQPTAPMATDFRSSGYTHTRSSLNYGQSADNYHRVEQWGPPVQPYGEWRFPYRPYSVPYSEWGPPLAGLGLYGGGRHWGAGGPGGVSGHVPGGSHPFDPYPTPPGSPYPNAPYFDGYHPVYRD